MKRCVLSALLLCFFIFGISCTLIPSDEEKIKSKIDAFCTAYNNGELEDAIDCLDAKSRNKLNKTISLTQGVLGLFGVSVDLDQLLKDLWGVSVLMISDENLLTIEMASAIIANIGAKAGFRHANPQISANIVEKNISPVEAAYTDIQVQAAKPRETATEYTIPSNR